MLLKLVGEKDPSLKKFVPLVSPKAEPANLKILAEDMHETRKAHKAVGLAANQCGVPVRMFVMGKDGIEFTCINPEVVSVSETLKTDTEGCLSFPSLLLKVSRPAEIRVKYLDADLEVVECDLKGVFARCFLHELDHLNGVTFTDKVSKLVLAMARKKQQRAQRFK